MIERSPQKPIPDNLGIPGVGPDLDQLLVENELLRAENTELKEIQRSHQQRAGIARWHNKTLGAKRAHALMMVEARREKRKKAGLNP